MGRFFSVERGGCMGISLSDEIRQLLDRANFAHLATLMPDGSPQSVPVWIGRDGDRIIVCTGENSLKAKTRAAIPEWPCRSSISIIPTWRPRFEDELSSAGPIQISK